MAADWVITSQCPSRVQWLDDCARNGHIKDIFTAQICNNMVLQRETCVNLLSSSMQKLIFFKKRVFWQQTLSKCMRSFSTKSRVTITVLNSGLDATLVCWLFPNPFLASCVLLDWSLRAVCPWISYLRIVPYFLRSDWGSTYKDVRYHTGSNDGPNRSRHYFGTLSPFIHVSTFSE